MDAFLNRLERRIGWLAIPHLTLVLVFLQIAGFCMDLMGQDGLLHRLDFYPALVREGEVYRAFTFMLHTGGGNVVFQVLWLIALYYAGNVVESGLGRFRFTLYVLLAWALTVVSSMIAYSAGAFPFVVDNWFLYSSLLIALAAIAPEETVSLYMVIPVKLKYFGFVIALFYLFQLVQGLRAGDWMTVSAGLSAAAAYALFFGTHHRDAVRVAKRRTAFRTKQVAIGMRALHRCEVCQRSEKSNPDLTFRVCSTCTQGQEYCEDHLRDHPHS